MSRCEHYTLDCEQEKMTCEGCAYNKKSAAELIKEDEEREEKYKMQGLGSKVADETYLEKIETLIIASKEIGREILLADDIPTRKTDDDPDCIFITLKEIQEYCKSKGYDGTILVFNETPLEGKIYRYGNYRPKFWQLIGTTIGYA